MISSDYKGDGRNHNNNVEECYFSGEELDETGEKEASAFDQTIGHMEDILIDGVFQQLQFDFLDKYWHLFEDDEENKLIYTDIFNQYVCTMETYIEKYLKTVSPGFNLEGFLLQVSERKPSLDGEVFDMLFSLSDFLSFKEMMLDYRAVKEGKIVDFSEDLLVTPINIED